MTDAIRKEMARRVLDPPMRVYMADQLDANPADEHRWLEWLKLQPLKDETRSA